MPLGFPLFLKIKKVTNDQLIGGCKSTVCEHRGRSKPNKRRACNSEVLKHTRMAFKRMYVYMNGSMSSKACNLVSPKKKGVQLGANLKSGIL